MVRTPLYEAAKSVLSRVARFTALKRWAVEVAKRRGLKRARGRARAQDRRYFALYVGLGTEFVGRRRSWARASRRIELKKLDSERQKAAPSAVPSPGRWSQ